MSRLRCSASGRYPTQDVAEALEISEASVKRTFSEQTFTLQRLEDVCRYLDISFYDLVRGARNRMRDEAYNLGANFVQIEMENQSHNTAEESLGGVYSSVIIGNAYVCPKI